MNLMKIKIEFNVPLKFYLEKKNTLFVKNTKNSLKYISWIKFERNHQFYFGIIYLVDLTLFVWIIRDFDLKKKIKRNFLSMINVV